MEDGVEISNLTIPIAKGDKGDAGKISSLAVTMLASTATPTVTNNGTVYDAQYVLGIPKGTGVASAIVDENGHLSITLTDGTTTDVGNVVGTGISNVYIDGEYNLMIVLTDETEINAGNIEDNLSGIVADYLENYYDKDTADGKFALITETGNKIDLSINSSTYVMTLTLKDKNNNTLSTGTVDLPLESVVVSGSYDSVNKKIILTLQSGSTIEFSVADLVAGLQTEITNANKLSADLVDDTSTTHKFVTASNKTAWNAKYDKPSGGIPSTDMTSAVQTSLGKADSALQTTDIVSSVDSSSTNSKAVGAKLFYDTLGDLETILQTLDIGSGV